MTKSTKQKASPEVAQDLLASFIGALRDKFETDLDLETTTGVEIDLDGRGKIRLKRAVARNHEFSKMVREKLTPYMEKRGELAEGEEDPKGNRIMADVYAQTLVTGLVSPDGVEIPYDDAAKEAVATLLASTPDLFTRIQNASQDAENYRKSKLESEAKN